MDVREVYERLLTAWNERDAHGFAEQFAEGATMIGFDGSQATGAEIVEHLTPIFRDHPTARYVAKVREVREVGGAILLRAIVGMVPPGGDALKPDVNAVQTVVTDAQGRIVSFQNTPAQYHGRPELAEQHTAELERLRAAGLTVG